jgi:hypothetical protein
MAAPDNATKPDPNGEGGADVQFDMGKGDITFSALGQDFEIKKFSGTAMQTLMVVAQMAVDRM